MSLKRFWFVVALLMQAADGWMTYVGVMRMGHEAEANDLVVAVMHAIGIGEAVIAVKLFGVLCIIMVYAHKHERSADVLALLSAVYYVRCILPWVVALYLTS